MASATGADASGYTRITANETIFHVEMIQSKTKEVYDEVYIPLWK